MAVPRIFGTQAAGNVPASYLDVDFSWLLNGTTLATNYGVIGDDATDNAAAINLALAAVASGGILIFPAGVIRTSGSHVIPTNTIIVGQGVGVTTLRGTGVNQTILSVGDGATNPNNVVLSDFSWDYTVAQTTSAAIRVRNGHNITLSRLRSGQQDTNIHTHIRLDGGAQQYGYVLNDMELGSGAYGITLGETGTPQQIWLNNLNIAGCTVAGISFQDASGIDSLNVDILSCARGVEIIPGNGQRVNALAGVNWTLDTCVENGLHIEPTGTGYCFANTISRLWASSSHTDSSDKGNGVFIAAAAKVYGLALNGFEATNNYRNGARILGGDNIYIHAPKATKNGQASSGTYAGIYFGADVSNWAVIGGLCGLANEPTLPNTQKYGIEIAAGTGDHIAIVGVDLTGNLTGPVLNGATGTDVAIIGCPGYTTGDLFPHGVVTSSVTAPTGNLALNSAAGQVLTLGDGTTRVNVFGNNFFPQTTNAVEMGLTTNRWAAVRAEFGDFSANVAASTLSTDAPAGSSSGIWKIGALQAGAITVDTTRSIFVDIGGVVYKLVVAT